MDDGFYFDDRTEKEKQEAERVAERSRQEAKKELFGAFLENLRKELEKATRGNPVTCRRKFSPGDFFSKEFHKIYAEKVTEHETRFPNVRAFEERGMRYALGIFPRDTVKQMLDTDPGPSETFHCVVHDERALPVIKECAHRWAGILGIRNLTITKKYGEGNLSPASQGGELSPAQETGELTIIEK